MQKFDNNFKWQDTPASSIHQAIEMLQELHDILTVLSRPLRTKGSHSITPYLLVAFLLQQKHIHQ